MVVPVRDVHHIHHQSNHQFEFHGSEPQLGWLAGVGDLLELLTDAAG